MTTTTIDATKLALLDTFSLDPGAHPSFDAGHCAMELVAWLAGEKHSDSPACACPVVAGAARRLNDRIRDTAMRTELMRPLLPRIVGSRASRAVMVKRGFIAADMAVRVFAPIALEKRGRLDLATALRGLPEIVNAETARSAREKVVEVRRAAAGAGAAAAAVADAADAADADAADADAAYAAAAAGAAAAGAAAAADAAYAVRRPIYEQGIAMIARMLDVTEESAAA